MKYNFEGKIININDKELETLEKNHKDLTREECIYLWLEDNEIVDNEEIDEMTEKGKKNVKIYNKSTKERKKSTRERKVDETKKALLKMVAECLKDNDIEILNIKTETEINFNYGTDNFTLKLTKHRPKK